MKELIKYIGECLKKHENISIYMDNTKPSDIIKLQKHFNVTKEAFGYYKFENK